ncbi:Vacuolar protein-sorting-associated protein 27 [Chytriomyces hyalinus]|nr:Vacuolar protein-sorting-associated protein 27 [Chytriomyces hyalinus]
MSFLFGGSMIDELVDKATVPESGHCQPNQIEENASKPGCACNQTMTSLQEPKHAIAYHEDSGAHFLVEVAGKDFIDTLVSLGGLLPMTDLAVRKAALALIQGWGLSFKGKLELAYACEVYQALKREGVPFPPVERAEVSSIMIDMTTTPEWSDSHMCMRCHTQFTTFNRKHHRGTEKLIEY